MNYRGANQNAQSKRDGIFSLNLAASKDIFKEKASITLNVSDVFNSRKRMQTTFIPDVFNQYSEFQWRERQITLSLVYRFNQKKERNQRGNDEYGGDGDFEG